MTKSYYRVISSSAIRSARMPFLLLFITCFITAIFVTTGQAGARAVNLAELASHAARIVHGRVSDVREGVHPKNERMAVTFVTLEVTEMLKGNAARSITFMQFGDSTHQYAVHLPQYKVGEELVLFLYAESKLGFTSPVGEGQGKFLVRDDVRTGTRLLLNEQLNQALFAKMDSARMSEKIALTRAERALFDLSADAVSRKLEFSTFRSLVRKIAANPKALAQ